MKKIFGIALVIVCVFWLLFPPIWIGYNILIRVPVERKVQIVEEPVVDTVNVSEENED